MIQRVSCEIGGKTLTLETGRLAKQADGSVLVTYGETMVLVTACSNTEPKPDIDFMPLTVEFQEKFYAAGKIPGSFHRREGRPTSEATLSARQIDRPLRPLFPEGYYCDTQIVATVISLDPTCDTDMAAAVGASAALHISDIPFNGPTAGCRVGRIDGKFVVNPSWSDVYTGVSDLEVFVAGTANAIMMVEGGAREISEEQMLEAIMLGHGEIKKLVKIVEDLRKLAGKPKREFKPAPADAALAAEIEKIAKSALQTAFRTKEKAKRYALADETKAKVLETLIPASLKDSDPNAAKKKTTDVKKAFELLQYNLMRQMILTDKIRIDGRDSKTIRPITVEAGLLPRAHGSALFTRGETQVLGAVTLGTTDDEQIVDSLHINTMRKYMLHYNFPPFSVGETGRMGGQSRREIGHGALAERSVKALVPAYETFPYTIRIVAETLESNGSSSMGSICAASMALMDAGVPIKKAVGGIAMGLIKESNGVAILSDILGDEDHLGDMDFKVAGSKDGITGIQMDIKIEGIDESIMKSALTQAREGRLHILNEMSKAITQARTEMSKYAPRITTIQIPIDKIRDVIGSGGKVIRSIVAETGCKIDISDDGKINIASTDGIAAQKAIDIIKGLTAQVELGATYKGIVKKVVDFGAFIAVLPGTEGLLHVSEIAHERVANVTDHMVEGDEIEVKVIDIDRAGKIRLSRKVLLPPPAGGAPRGDGGGGQGGGGRGPRPIGGGGGGGGQPRH